MWANRAVTAFYRDLMDTMIRSRSPYVTKTLLDRLTREIRSKDMAWQQTLKSLEGIRLNQLELRDLKLFQARLRGLAWQSRGLRMYTNYSEVEKDTQYQSSFQKQEVDFSESSKGLLDKLAERIELTKERQAIDRQLKTQEEESPELMEPTPGPR
jgi:hypothetical protein